MRLYGYFRSSASYRVRIALNLKEIAVEHMSIDMARGAQGSASYRALNPHGLVPALEVDGGVVVQSLAICEYLEETFPRPALMPADPLARAYVRGLCGAVASDFHPLNNRRVLLYLENDLGLDQAVRLMWYRHWIDTVFPSIETTLTSSGRAGWFCYGDQPGLADVFLIPQVYNARQFQVDMAPYPTITAICTRANALPTFANALPEAQPDAVALSGVYAAPATETR